MPTLKQNILNSLPSNGEKTESTTQTTTQTTRQTVKTIPTTKEEAKEQLKQTGTEILKEQINKKLPNFLDNIGTKTEIPAKNQEETTE